MAMHIVVFDLETTGFSPSCNEIIQIAGIRMREGVILEQETFATFVRPVRYIPGNITELTGITHAQVQDAPEVVDALMNFSRFAGDATLLAHNGRRFDMPFIRESCARHKLPVRPVSFIDSMDLSKKIWGGRGGHGLDGVMARLGLSANGSRRHDARGDVQILAEAVHRMWSQLSADFAVCPVGCHTGEIPMA